jgi:hypothetical protein
VDRDSREERILARNWIKLIRAARRYREATRDFSRKRKRSDIRSFQTPILNFAAQRYNEMVNLEPERIKDHHVQGWENPPREYFYRVFTVNYKGPIKRQLLTEPPAVMDMTDAQLDSIVDDPTLLDIWAPCHSQTVEQKVAVTSMVVGKYRKFESQLGAALQVDYARQANPGEITHKSRALAYEEKELDSPE